MSDTPEPDSGPLRDAYDLGYRHGQRDAYERWAHRVEALDAQLATIRAQHDALLNRITDIFACSPDVTANRPGQA